MKTIYEAIELQLEEASYYESVKSRIDENRFVNRKLLREFLGTRRFRRNDKQKQAEIESILSEGDSWSMIEEEDDDTLESEIKLERDDETKEETAAGTADFFGESGSTRMPKHKVMNHFPFFDFLNGKQKSRRTAAKTEQPTDNKPLPIHAPTEKESFEQDKTTSFLEEVREEPEWACSAEEDDDDGSSGVLASYSFNRNWSEMATRSVGHTFVPTEEASSTVGSFASPLLPKNDEMTFKRPKKRQRSKVLFKNYLGKRTARHHISVQGSKSKTLIISKTESFKKECVPLAAASVRSVACMAQLSSFSIKSHQDSESDGVSKQSNIEHSSSSSTDSSSTNEEEENSTKVIHDNKIQRLAATRLLSAMELFFFNREDDWTEDHSYDDSYDSYSFE
jgi:hypothetical protein